MCGAGDGPGVEGGREGAQGLQERHRAWLWEDPQGPTALVTDAGIPEQEMSIRIQVTSEGQTR